MSKKEDAERLEELKMKVWGLAAKNMLIKTRRKDPLTLPASWIEGHKGRREKAIRFLTDAGHIRYHGKEKEEGYSSWSREESIYKVISFDSSKSAAESYEFPVAWKDLYSDVYGRNSSYEEFCMVGYSDIGGMQSAHALHVYWYPELYDIIDLEGHREAYPKALLVGYTQGILRCIVEHHMAARFRDLLANRLGMPDNSLPEKDEKSIRYRNCGHTLGMFNEAGLQSYLDEYSFRETYFRKLKEGLGYLMERTQSTGGYEVAIREMRQDLLCRLMKEAPLHLGKPNDNNQDDNGNYISYDDIKSPLKRHHESLYILRNNEYWNYETLYGADESVIHISSCTIETDQHQEFQPDAEDMRVVESTAQTIWAPQIETNELEAEVA